MQKSLYILTSVLFLVVGCDSFPKRMQSEKTNLSTESDGVQVSAGCIERANPFPLAEFKHFIILKFHIVNSSDTQIEFTPKDLVTPEQHDFELTLSNGAKESSKKVELSQKKVITVPTAEDYLIDLYFGLKNEEQLKKAVFKISGISKNGQKRKAETLICNRSVQ
jgi:hypothetical protein